MAKKPKSYLILEFNNDEEKSRFVGGLLDGWGENGPFSISWDSGKADKDGRCEVPATEAPLLRVKVFPDDRD